MTFVLSIDPGPESSGYAYLTEETVIDLGDTGKLGPFLKSWNFAERPIDQIVVEGYYINPRQQDKIGANVGTTLDTSERVGQVKFWAEMHDLPVHEYFNRIKKTVAKATGVDTDNRKLFTKAMSHRWDAYNYGRYWLIQHKGAPTKLELDMKARGEL